MYRTEEFDQEIKALQGLGRHPHIVRLVGYSKEFERCYLIMEKLDNDLETALFEISHKREKNKIAPTRPLSDVQAVALMLQIGEGVKYIHSKKMAHRDLKPGNVLINLAHPSCRISSVKIADFGLTKTQNATHTNSNQTHNRGTNRYMAPEVIPGERDTGKYSRFNPMKADVYSFAITCSEILTGVGPYDADLSPIQMKEQVKEGKLRPSLPEDCPPKLAALMKRCWHQISQERPLFPEICKELRYIKGLLLRGDLGKLEAVVEHDIRPPRALETLERVQLQGPWGGAGGDNVLHVYTSINRMKFTYHSPGILGSMEMNYSFAGRNFSRKCCGNVYGDQYAEIVFEHFEYIMHISGFVSQTHIDVLGPGKVPIVVVASLTIHTNIRSYGPFGDEKGEPFASEKGKVIGFHGGSGHVLDSLGVVVFLNDTS